MVKYLSDIFDIFSSIFTYKNINDVCERKMRNIKNGISLLQSVNFTFNYNAINLKLYGTYITFLICDTILKSSS